MKSKIAVCVFSLSIAILSLSLGGCSDMSTESADSPQSTIENSSVNLPVSENSQDNESSEETENSEPKIPEGEPTFLTAPDGTPIYMSEITKYQNSAEFHGTHEQFPLDRFNKETFSSRYILCDHPEVVCDGFAYAFIPRFNINYSAAPDKFEEFDSVSLRYTGELLPDGNDYFRLEVGDKFGGLTVKSACTKFNFYNAVDVEDPDSIPGLYLSGAEIQYEGEVEMTGCIQVMETFGYSTSGELNFYPDGDCVSQIPAAAYYTESGNPKRGVFYGAVESWGSYGELNEIFLGNMYDYNIDFDGLEPGDKNVRVKITIKDPTITFNYTYMWCSGEPVAVTVLE